MKSNPYSTLHRTIFWPTFSLLLLLSGFLQAQEKKQQQVNVQIDLVSLGEEIPGLRLGRKSAGKTLTAYAFRYSLPIRYSGSRILEISQAAGSKTKQKQEPGEHDIVPLPPQQLPDAPVAQKDNIARAIAKRRERNPELVALAVIPLRAKHITILMAPSANNTYRCHVVSDDPSKLPLGQVRIHNFCPHPISLRLNNRKEDIIVTSGKSQRAMPKAKNRQLIYRLSYPKSGKWKVQENNVIRVPIQEQVHVFVMRSQSSYFASATGARGGKMQVAILRRNHQHIAAARKPTPQPTTPPPALPKPPPNDGGQNAPERR